MKKLTPYHWVILALVAILVAVALPDYLPQPTGVQEQPRLSGMPVTAVVTMQTSSVESVREWARERGLTVTGLGSATLIIEDVSPETFDELTEIDGVIAAIGLPRPPTTDDQSSP